MLDVVDVRCGLGAGEIDLIDGTRTPLVQDGPAWWSAREALEELARPRRQAARTWYVGPGADGAMAFLLVRDTLVDRLGERGHRLLAGALRGRTQAELAAAEGIGRSTVSHHFARGVGAVSEAQQRFVVATRGDDDS
jgi:DNA-binding CsgD family transcriptional regulator